MFSTQTFARVVFVVSSALALSACLTNQTGNVEAQKLGDISRPAATGSPVAELQAACGAGGAMTTAGEATVLRQPYLQQVTTATAMIGWVSKAESGERVDVTSPDGAEVDTAAAQVEATAIRTAGEHQVWAQVDGLSPDTVYCYVVSDGQGALTEPIGFRTAPTADSERTVRFLAFGDSGGGGSDQQALLEQMFQYPYELMIHTGDLAYDSGTMGQIEATVFGIYADLFRHLPFFPAAGNHDYKTQQGAPFRDVFALPGSGDEKWYSYDWGRIHFMALDTESDYDTQMTWLESDLAATSLPWKILYLHHPPYSSGGHGSDTTLRTKLAPILKSHGVQLVLAGHDHDYERMIPQDGVAYVVTGGGGVGTRPVETSSFTAFSLDVIHYVLVEVSADELVLHAIDATGQEFDSMVVPVAPSA